MASFKTPDFNTRTAAAREARQRALDRLREKPAPDPEVVAARRAARKAEADAAKEQAAQAKADALKAASEAAERSVPSEAELKALRDARYASRKARRR